MVATEQRNGTQPASAGGITKDLEMVDKLEALYRRLEKAKHIVMEDGVRQLPDNTFQVRGQETPSRVYDVAGTCNCPDAKKNADTLNGICKHRLATYLWARTQEARDLSW